MSTNEILANQVALIVSADVALEAFMKDDVNLLINAFTAHGIHPKKAETLLREWSYDYTRGITSNFATYQMRLLSMAQVAGKLSESFMMHMVTNSSFLGTENYGNLSMLAEEMQKVEERRVMESSTQRTM